MKHILALCLALLLLVPCGSLAQGAIIDLTDGQTHAFAPDAKLLEIYFPKIYGCDSALIRCGEYAMLLDCAGNQNAEVSKMLSKLGVTELTYALNSHPDADHIGGFQNVLKKIPAKEFLMGFPEDYPHGDDARFKVYNAMHEFGIPMRQVAHGESIDFGDVKMTVYQRTDEHLPRVNNKSVLLRIEYGARSILFAGDIQAAAQELLAADAQNIVLKADILKYPHHGYEPMVDEFMQAVSPELAICTAGQRDINGVQWLRELGVSYSLTGSSALRLATDGETWTLEKIRY